MADYEINDLNDECGLVLTFREVEEIKHAIFYADECNHGTVGHNLLILIAKLANHAGITLKYEPETTDTDSRWSVVVPGNISLDDER